MNHFKFYFVFIVSLTFTTWANTKCCGKRRKASRADRSARTPFTSVTSAVRTSASKLVTKWYRPSIWHFHWTAIRPTVTATFPASPSSRVKSAKRSSTASVYPHLDSRLCSSCSPCASSSPSWSHLSSAITDNCKRPITTDRLILTWTSVWAASSLRPSHSVTGAPFISSGIPANPSSKHSPKKTATSSRDLMKHYLL